MYLVINGNKHTVSRRVVKPDEIRYLSVTPAPEDVSGVIQMYDESLKVEVPKEPVFDEDGFRIDSPEPEYADFLISEDDADSFLRWTYSGTLLILTNVPEPEKPTEEEMREELERSVRGHRDSLIAETDWTQVLDAPITPECKEAFRLYRQALRDVPQQENFPYDIIWPVKPEVVKADPDPVDTALEILVGGEE